MGSMQPCLLNSIGQQADASKVLRDELGGNFHRLGTRVSDSLTEAGISKRSGWTTSLVH